MSQSEETLESRRKLARQMRSKIRSAEYRKKRFWNSVYLWSTIFLLVGVPLLFYGGIEYGYWHEPTSIGFKMYASVTWVIILWAFKRIWEQYSEYQKRDDLILKLEMETIGLDEETESPQTEPATA